jgi:hypothetical protein
MLKTSVKFLCWFGVMLCVIFVYFMPFVRARKILDFTLISKFLSKQTPCDDRLDRNM